MRAACAEITGLGGERLNQGTDNRNARLHRRKAGSPRKPLPQIELPSLMDPILADISACRKDLLRKPRPRA